MATLNHDGLKLRTSSNRRYVTFGVSDDSVPFIIARTDNPETADANQRSASRRYLRAITVDWADLGTSHTGPRVRSDSATYLPR